MFKSSKILNVHLSQKFYSGCIFVQNIFLAVYLCNLSLSRDFRQINQNMRIQSLIILGMNCFCAQAQKQVDKKRKYARQSRVEFLI